MFTHQQSAHCESGVMSSLLTNAGLPISEPMAFGLSSALSFAYLPFIKLGGMPLIAYRMPPKHIIKTLSKRLGVRLHSKKFNQEQAGEAALNQAIEQQRLVGVQTSVFWLPYFPAEMRFHFNAHNLLVYGKENNDYLVSDPVFENTVHCAAADMQKARFAKGALAAKGFMYWLEDMPEQVDWPKIIRQSIKATSRSIDSLPLPWIGIRGIQHLAKKIIQLDNKPLKYRRLYLTHIVRMQEEIGTGGAGFRFMYASFLQEAGELLNQEVLLKAAETLTDIGDQWREFALACVKHSQGKEESLSAIADRLISIAEQERTLFKHLGQWAK